MNKSNVIIIGAARSGTNMLRDILSTLENFATWPCDEINYIWRYGLRNFEHDSFRPELADEMKKKYIKNKFNWVRKKYNVENVIEKTCANSLRVDYIDKLLDDKKYIFIVRDPFDVVSSAKLRWKAKLDIKYIFDKARFVPISDLPYYSFNYFINRLKKITSKEKRLSYWGPKYFGFEEDAKKMSALELSAKQWLMSVNFSVNSFLNMDSKNYIFIDYNAFVLNPVIELKKILDFLEVDILIEEIEEMVKEVSSSSVGKGKNKLSKSEIEKVSSVVGNRYEEVKKIFLGEK